MPHYFPSDNTQTGNMYIPATTNMNQQIAQVSNMLQQTLLMPAIITPTQQPSQQTPLKVSHHSDHKSMEEYEPSDGGSVIDDPATTNKDWQRV
jgi:hypothetical protein